MDTAIDVADNALTHNWLQTALENAAEYATDLAMENPENLEEIKHHILGEVSVEALEDCAAWIEAHPDEVALGVTTLMGAMDRNAEDRGAPVKDSKVQRRAKEKMLVKAITQSPTLLKDMVTKAKGVGVKLAPDPLKNFQAYPQKVNKRMPRNHEYAGKVYPLEKLPQELRHKYPHSVPFTPTGFPDFTRYAIKRVEIKFSGNTAKDMKIADKAVGFKKRPEGFTWHHHHDGKTMQLVPIDIHDSVKHTGGVAKSKTNIK